jgi:hypothetical protein
VPKFLTNSVFVSLSAFLSVYLPVSLPFVYLLVYLFAFCLTICRIFLFTYLPLFWIFGYYCCFPLFIYTRPRFEKRIIFLHRPMFCLFLPLECCFYQKNILKSSNFKNNFLGMGFRLNSTLFDARKNKTKQKYLWKIILVTSTEL